MSKKESSERASMKETVRLSLRGYRIWWEENPKLLISTAAYAVVNSLIPYVGIWLLARLIDEIAGLRNPQALTELALAIILSAAVLTMAGAGLKRWRNVQWAGIWYRQNKIFMTKLFSMDFTSINDPHTHDLRFQITQNSNVGAWGLYKLLFCFDDMVKSVMSIGGAAALTVSLFTQMVPAGGGRLTILNHPLFTVLIIAAMLAAAFLAPYFSEKADYYWIKHSDEQKMGNRLYSFWLGVLGSERSRALDIRIYRQDILSRNNLKQNNPFSSKSILAKAARGPMGAFHALSGVISQVFAGMAYLFVCLKALGGAFGAGSVTQYIGAVTALSQGVSTLIKMIGDMRNNTVFLKTAFEFLDIPNNMYQGTHKELAADETGKYYELWHAQAQYYEN